MPRTEFQKKKAEKIKAINGITAKSIISAAFAEAGYKVSIDVQCYRARVSVPILKGRRLRLYIRYRDLGKPDLMQGVLTAVEDLTDALTRLGPGACIKNG